MAEEISMSYLGDQLASEGIDAALHFAVMRVAVDELSMAHTRVQQLVGEVPVFGGQAIVHLNRDGSLFALTDTLLRGISHDFDTIPRFSPQVASDLVVARYDCVECLTAPPSVDLWVLKLEGQVQPRLVYRVQLWREDGTEYTEMPVLFLDARTGEEVWRYNNLQTVSGTGMSQYSGTVTLETYYRSSNATYYMEDTTRKMGTFDYQNASSSTFRLTDANNVWDTAAQRPAVDAHYGAMKTYDYYKNVLGRNGIDGNGGPGSVSHVDNTALKLVASYVRYSTNYNNAYWNGVSMTYGNGDGVTFSALTTVDIAGHEMTHGVTQSTANLVYFGQSGALNESFSDIFGAMVERYAKGESANTWKIGEECFTPGNGTVDAIRYIDNPHQASNNGYTADDDPDHYSERYTGSTDSGGVHVNSGIPNKAFYLLAKGGSHHLGGSMQGIGADKAALIWYKALTNYMTSSTTFAGARAATQSAAAALYGSGSAEHNAVGTAWSLVGVN